MLVAILAARAPETLQLEGQVRWLPASPWQGFLLGYVCGIMWFAGTCYWIFDTMHRYGNLPIPAAALALFLFCMYVGLYHGFFGLLLALVAGGPYLSKTTPSWKISGALTSKRRALAAAPFLWVAVELARTRVTAFPWELLGYSQTNNFALTRVATLIGVYGLSFEILLVNSVFAAAFLAPKERRTWLLAPAFGAALILQAGQLLPPPISASDHSGLLVQPNVPILESAMWTKEYFETTLRDLADVSLHPPMQKPATGDVRGAVASSETGARTNAEKFDLIVWPESPSPFYTNDPMFRDAVSEVARQSRTWVIAGAIGIKPAGSMSDSMSMSTSTSGSTTSSTSKAATTPATSTLDASQASQIFNSAALVSPQGEWVARYDKLHLVPFGEYLPFPQLFAFAGGLTKEVGEFQRGRSRVPLDAGGQRLGMFICYESIFPDEVREGPLQGAQLLVNISNDGWYGDSGAWSQHLQQTRMRAIENDRWLLSATNTGKTASIDPYGRIVTTVPRKIRTALAAPYALVSGTTFYTRHGDWFAYLCAIISAGAILSPFAFSAHVSKEKSRSE
jgi:apolipoprotein N-acyltransferase